MKIYRILMIPMLIFCFQAAPDARGASSPWDSREGLLAEYKKFKLKPSTLQVPDGVGSVSRIYEFLHVNRSRLSPRMTQEVFQGKVWRLSRTRLVTKAERAITGQVIYEDIVAKTKLDNITDGLFADNRYFDPSRYTAAMTTLVNQLKQITSDKPIVTEYFPPQNLAFGGRTGPQEAQVRLQLLIKNRQSPPLALYGAYLAPDRQWEESFDQKKSLLSKDLFDAELKTHRERLLDQKIKQIPGLQEKIQSGREAIGFLQAKNVTVAYGSDQVSACTLKIPKIPDAQWPKPKSPEKAPLPITPRSSVDEAASSGEPRRLVVTTPIPLKTLPRSKSSMVLCSPTGSPSKSPQSLTPISGSQSQSSRDLLSGLKSPPTAPLSSPYQSPVHISASQSSRDLLSGLQSLPTTPRPSPGRCPSPTGVSELLKGSPSEKDMKEQSIEYLLQTVVKNLPLYYVDFLIPGILPSSQNQEHVITGIIRFIKENETFKALGQDNITFRFHTFTAAIGQTLIPLLALNSPLQAIHVKTHTKPGEDALRWLSAISTSLKGSKEQGDKPILILLEGNR